MNKLDFLRRLDKELSVLEKEERREILAFYEERFYTGTIYENKTEEEVIAELEKPEVIARNVLEEYGVSPKYVKKSEERYSNVNSTQVVLIILFDIFVATWLLPSLVSVAFSILGSSVSYFATLSLLLGDVSTVDEFVFAFMTAGYYLYFLFGLVVLGATIFVTKTIVVWHLNVFKVKNREKYIKKLSRYSLDGWFKRHRGVNRVKNVLLVGALVTIGYTGFWIFNNFDWVEAEYGATDAQVETITEDFASEIADMDEWTIITDFDTMDVEIVLTDSDEMKIVHTYYEDDKFTYDFDFDTNELTLTQDYENRIFINVTDIFRLFGEQYKVRIEVPRDMILEEANIVTHTGTIDIRNVNFSSMDVSSNTGSIVLSYIELVDDIDASTNTGTILVRNVNVSQAGTLTLSTSTGAIDVESTNFDDYHITTNTGSISMKHINEDLQDGDTIVLQADTGSIKLVDVYADDITADTDTGSISYENSDESFEPSSWNASTDTGSVDTYFD
ncbi:DUF4097 family beta strand repeat-containing protein [Candidatus Xianfuyuplasma coldseepsis]|uniref:DUF1700 domain-containing protein n=1 Tax=Candidatus Xianfuyuplasma coldseepsis TaxID=2782163 RepID=A0A7L7KSK0_9MOLU|nr:DUF1700 domain-containing protein [Xianfuyuplasma coldseepsis]QMS84758.1 DUF1700 domain-containing protein [Xianfuyuplasma coldseepsis]